MAGRRQKLETLLHKMAPGLEDQFEIQDGDSYDRVRIRYKPNPDVVEEVDLNGDDDALRDHVTAVIEKSKQAPL